MYDRKRESLLIYNIIWSFLSSYFLTGLCFLRQNPIFLHWYLFYVFFLCHCPCSSLRGMSLSSICVLRALCDWERGGGTRLGRKQKNFARVCTKLFWSTVYWANPIPKPESPNGLRVEPDISIHILEPGSSLQFIKPGNILDGLHKRVIFTRGSATASRTLYFHTNRVMENLSCPFITGNCPSRFTWGIVGTYSDLVPSQLSVLSSL